MIARLLAIVFVLAMICSDYAHAALVTISGAGQFGPTDNPDPAYQSNASFTFSFVIDSPLSSNPITDLLQASYTLAGNAVAPPVAVSFFSIDDGGLFSLGFDNGGSLSLFGEDIGSSGTLISGVFNSDVFGSVQDFGSAVVTVSAIPLPSSLSSLGAGLFIIICMKRLDKWHNISAR